MLNFSLLIILLWQHPDQKRLVLPDVWSAKFGIHVSSGGGMINESYRADFYYDSAIYEKREGNSKKRRCIRLNERKRAAILAKLKTLKIGEVRSRKSTLKLDAGQTSVCLRNDDQETCLTDGSIEEIFPEDVDKFMAAYDFLLHYADPNKK